MWRRAASSDRGRALGEGLALAGLITGYVGIAFSILVVPMMAAIAVPNFVRARTTAQMNMCISNLRQLDGAKQQWALDNKKPETATPTWQDLEPYLKRKLECPVGGVYTISTRSVKSRRARSPTTGCRICERGSSLWA